MNAVLGATVAWILILVAAHSCGLRGKYQVLRVIGFSISVAVGTRLIALELSPDWAGWTSFFLGFWSCLVMDSARKRSTK